MPNLVKLCGEFCKSNSATAIAIHNDFSVTAADIGVKAPQTSAQAPSTDLSL